MITDLKPYAAYKDSGMSWLEDVPEHWEVERLKSYASNVVDQTSTRESGELYVALEHVESWTGRLKQKDSSVSFDSQVKRFRAGDVLFGKLRPYLAKVVRPTSSGVCVGEFFVLRARESRVNAAYLEHLLRSKLVIDVIDSSTFGARMPRADWQFVGSLDLPFPPSSEQAAIVRFLDYADRKIRRYIRAKQKLIKLLEEQKQVIIHHAVTRGLEPNVRLKPSGVEWLGEVPEHWEVKPAKWYYREVDDRSSTGSEELLSVSHITGVTPRSEKNVTMFMAESYAGHKLCRKGDLVINTMWAWMAALGVTGEAGIVSPSYAVYRPIKYDAFIPEFIDRILRTRAYVAEYICRSTGIRSSRLRLYPEQFLRIPLVRPSREEQQSILVAIADSTGELESAMQSARREIDLLREYRTRLIADVVTGKLDVREATASLPEEPEEEDIAPDVDEGAEEEAIEDEALEAESLSV